MADDRTITPGAARPLIRAAEYAELMRALDELRADVLVLDHDPARSDGIPTADVSRTGRTRRR